MYTVTIPVMMGERFERDAALAELKRAKADRALLIHDRVFRDTPEGGRIDTDRFFTQIAETIPYVREAGMEAAVWLGETMGHGWGAGRGNFAYTPFTNIRGIEGNAGFCCADELFISDVCEWAANAAKTGASLIILDDDWRMGGHGDGVYAGCMCAEHIKRYCELVGENLTREEIVSKVFTGGASKYREEWKKLMGGDMLRLAHEIRASVDKINPECRIGICTAPSVVDLDGANFMEIADALAGNTRPYVRLIVASYWAKSGADLASVIATERMEADYCRKWRERRNAEVVFEGDPYPRPRFNCPAAYLESSDIACRADKNFTGIQKYMLDYGSTMSYEKGYIDKHERNAALAAKVEKFFDGLTQTGFRPYEHIAITSDMDLGDEPLSGNLRAYNMFRGISMRYFTNASVPLSFEEGVPVVFGENARHVPVEFIAKGAILDLTAAEMLMKRGIDVGVKEIRPFSGSTAVEYFPSEDEYVRPAGMSVREAVPADGAEIMSFFGSKPASFRYERADGAKFAIFSMDAYPDEGSSFFRSYSRQRQLYALGEWMTGEKIEAEITGNPDVYIAVSKSSDSAAVLIENLFSDDIDYPIVKLAHTPKSIEYAGCTGTVIGNEVHLSPINAFGICTFRYEF